MATVEAATYWLFRPFFLGMHTGNWPAIVVAGSILGATQALWFWGSGYSCPSWIALVAVAYLSAWFVDSIAMLGLFLDPSNVSWYCRFLLEGGSGGLCVGAFTAYTFARATGPKSAL